VDKVGVARLVDRDVYQQVASALKLLRIHNKFSLSRTTSNYEVVLLKWKGSEAVEQKLHGELSTLTKKARGGLGLKLKFGL
jgi:hypothetical protein